LTQRRIALTLALGFLTGLAAQTASAQLPRMQRIAQKEKVPAPRNDLKPAPKANNGAAAKNQPNLRGMAGLPPKWVERLQDMPPNEQQHFMQNNQQVQNLPAQRQEQSRKTLERWNSLAPDQKTALRNEEAVLERMSPPQRQYLRNVLLPKWQAMPVERRQAINGRLRILRNMSPATQQAALNDPKFVDGLSADEQSMLRELNSFRNPSDQ
jgi:hypothetical protein